MYFVISLPSGTSGGLSFSVGLLVVPAYFDKNKGAAMAIVLAGVSVGQLSVPLILRVLLDNFGFRGAILIFGGMLANCCVAALCFHPVEWHQKDAPKRKQTQISASNTAQPDEQITLTKRKTTDNSSNISTENEIQPISIPVKIVKTAIQHMSVIKQLRVTIATLSLAFLVVGYANFNAQLPIAMMDQGHEPKEASFVLFASGLCNAILRITTAVVSDRRWFNRKYCFIFSSFTAGCATLSEELYLYFPYS